MALVSRSWHWLPNSTSPTYDGHYPAGDRPAGPPSLQWATSGYPVINTLVTNNAYSEEIRAAHLSGGDAGIATLTLDQVSGDNYATENWSMTGDNLTHPSNSDQGAGVFRHKAVSGATTVYSPNRSWAYLPPPEIQVKWNPGMYMMPETLGSVAQSFLDEMATMHTDVQGIYFRTHWGSLNPTGSTYDWSLPDAVQAFCAAQTPKRRWMIRVLLRGSIAQCMPADIANASTGYFIAPSTNGNHFARVWRAEIRARLMTFIAAFAARYNSDPLFEQFAVHESVRPMNQTDQPADYTNAIHHDYMVDFAHDGPVLFPHTSCAQFIDFGFNSQTLLADLIEQCRLNRCAVHGDDNLPQVAGFGNAHEGSNADHILMGETWNGSAWVAAGTDYRGQLDLSRHLAGPEMGGKEGSWSPQAHYDWALNLAINRFCVLHKTVQYAQTVRDIYWSSGVDGAPYLKDFWNAGSHPMATAVPPYYPNVVTGGT